MSDAGSRIKLNFLLVALAVLVLDQWTKRLAEVQLAGRPPVPVIPGLFDLAYVTNTGVAFGLFPSGGSLIGTVLLTVAGLGALTVVGLYYWRTPATQRLLLTSLALVLGGAIGNLVDRIMKGSVTDFLDVYLGSYHWPTFNVADSAICIGIVLMALETLRPGTDPVSVGEEVAGN